MVSNETRKKEEEELKSIKIKISKIKGSGLYFEISHNAVKHQFEEEQMELSTCQCIAGQ